VTENLEVWIPRGGVSLIAVPGQVFEDNDADWVLSQTIKEGLKGTGVRIVEDEREINDASFAVAMAESLMRLSEKEKLEI
jgi:uncharacterized protein (UPF0261 family)